MDEKLFSGGVIMARDKLDEHFHTIRILNVLRGKKAFCVQPRCTWSGAPELLHRKLLECEVCFDHFLFDYDAYEPKPGEHRILCWKCAGAPKIGMTLEQEKTLLERELKQLNMSALQEFEDEFTRKKSELTSHEKALNNFSDELDKKAKLLVEKEETLNSRKRKVIQFLESVQVKHKQLILRIKELEIQIKELEFKERVMKEPKAPKEPKEPKEPKPKKAEIDLALEAEKDRLKDAIFEAVLGSTKEQFENNSEPEV